MCNFIAHRKNNVSFLLERKIVENQLCTSNRNVKCVVLLPIVRKTSHFMSLVIYCVLLQVHLRNRTSFCFLTDFIQSDMVIDCTCPSLTGNLFSKKHRTVMRGINYFRALLLSWKEKQLETSGAPRTKCIVLLPIVRITSHFYWKEKLLKISCAPRTEM